MEEMEILKQNLEELNNSINGRRLEEIGVIELRRLKGDYEALHELNLELQERLRRTDSVDLNELRDALNLGEDLWEGVRIALSPLAEILRSKVALVFEKRKQINRLRDERARNRALLDSTRNQLELTRNAMTRITDPSILESYERIVELLNTNIENLENLDDSYADQIDRLLAEEAVLRLGGTFTDLDEIEALSTGITSEEEATLTREARREREEGAPDSEDSLGEVPIIGSEDLTRGLNLGDTVDEAESEESVVSRPDLDPIYTEGTVSGDEAPVESPEESEMVEIPKDSPTDESPAKDEGMPEFPGEETPETYGEGMPVFPTDESPAKDEGMPEFPGEETSEKGMPEFPGEEAPETHAEGMPVFPGEETPETHEEGMPEFPSEEAPETHEEGMPEFPGGETPETHEEGMPEFPGGEAPETGSTREPVVVPPTDYHVSEEEEPVRAVVTEPKSGLWSKLTALYRIVKIVLLAGIAVHTTFGTAYAPGVEPTSEVEDSEDDNLTEEPPVEESEEPSLVPISYEPDPVVPEAPEEPSAPEVPETPDEPETPEEELKITLGPNESVVNTKTGIEVSSDGSSYNLNTGTTQKKKNLPKDGNGNSVVTNNDLVPDAKPERTGAEVPETEAVAGMTSGELANFNEAVGNFDWDALMDQQSNVR